MEELKGKWFYSLIERHGFEFGKKYQVLDVLNPEKANKEYVKDYCTIVVDLQDGGKGSQFFKRMFSEKLEGLIPIVQDRIMREKREYDKLKPQFEKITKNFRDSEQKIGDLKNLLTDIVKRTLTDVQR